MERYIERKKKSYWTTLCLKINEEEIHLKKRTSQTSHDGKINTHIHRPSVPHQNSFFIPERKETLPRPVILRGRITIRSALKTKKINRKLVTLLSFRTRFYAAQILLVLEYLHSKNIIYREYYSKYSVSNQKMYSLEPMDISNLLTLASPKIISLETLTPSQSAERPNTWLHKSSKKMGMASQSIGGVLVLSSMS